MNKILKTVSKQKKLTYFFNQRLNNEEIDLLILDDTRRLCLLIELKSMLIPSEPREVIDRRKKITLGLTQVRRKAGNIRNASFSNRDLSTYKHYYLLCIRGFVGEPIQPIGNEIEEIESFENLVNLLKSFGNIKHLMDNRNKRRFLPIENKDFKIVKNEIKIGERLILSSSVDIKTDCYNYRRDDIKFVIKLLIDHYRGDRKPFPEVILERMNS